MLPHGFTTAVLVQPSIRFAAGRGYTIANGQFRFGCGSGPHLMDFQDPAAQFLALGNESVPVRQVLRVAKAKPLIPVTKRLLQVAGYRMRQTPAHLVRE